MINDNDIMTISINNHIPLEFTPVSKHMLMNYALPIGVEIHAEPIDFNKKQPIINGVFVSINNERNLYSRLTMKIRTDSGSYKTFMPIKYDILYRYKKTKKEIENDNMRATMMAYLEQLENMK